MSNGTAVVAICVTVVLALCGWRVQIWLENHKTNKDELTKTAEKVATADMQVRSIIGLGRPAIGSELNPLRVLIDSVERAADQHDGELRTALQELARLLRALVRAEAPALAEVRAAHLLASQETDVPAALSVESLATHGQEQGALHPQIQAAVRDVERHIRRQRRLRFTWHRPTA
ncbi:hypothetical protein [Streptomyces sp. NPDC004976]